MRRTLKILSRYAGEFVLGMMVMAAIWLLIAAVLVTLWPLSQPAAAKPSHGGRAGLPEVVTWRVVAAAPAPVEVNETELPLAVPVAGTNRLPPPTPAPRSGSLPVTVSPDPVSPLAGWPVRGEVSNPFGCTVYYSGRPGPGCPAAAPWFHDGLDLAAPTGQPVRAALSGTVLFAGPDGSGPDCGDYRGYGLGVVVDTGNGWQALYAHLSRIEVSAGQVVTPDTLIGAVGETGCVSGPHLHFGLRYGTDLVDPQTVRQE